VLEPVDLRYRGFPRAIGVYVVETTDGAALLDCGPSTTLPRLRAGLRERGMVLKAGRAENSGLHGIVRLADGTYQGAADSRREGVARMLAPRAAGKPAVH